MRNLKKSPFKHDLGKNSAHNKRYDRPTYITGHRVGTAVGNWWDDITGKGQTRLIKTERGEFGEVEMSHTTHGGGELGSGKAWETQWSMDYEDGTFAYWDVDDAQNYMLSHTEPNDIGGVDELTGAKDYNFAKFLDDMLAAGALKNYYLTKEDRTMLSMVGLNYEAESVSCLNGRWDLMRKDQVGAYSSNISRMFKFGYFDAYLFNNEGSIGSVDLNNIRQFGDYYSLYKRNRGNEGIMTLMDNFYNAEKDWLKEQGYIPALQEAAGIPSLGSPRPNDLELLMLMQKRGNEHKSNLELHRAMTDIHGEEKVFFSAYAGNKFRQWVNDKYPDYAKNLLGKGLNTTGSFQNSFIKKAYEDYGEEYEKVKGNYNYVQQNSPWELEVEEQKENEETVTEWKRGNYESVIKIDDDVDNFKSALLKYSKTYKGKSSENDNVIIGGQLSSNRGVLVQNKIEFGTNSQEVFSKNKWESRAVGYRFKWRNKAIRVLGLGNLEDDVYYKNLSIEDKQLVDEKIKEGFKRSDYMYLSAEEDYFDWVEKVELKGVPTFKDFQSLTFGKEFQGSKRTSGVDLEKWVSDGMTQLVAGNKFRGNYYYTFEPTNMGDDVMRISEIDYTSGDVVGTIDIWLGDDAQYSTEKQYKRIAEFMNPDIDPETILDVTIKPHLEVAEKYMNFSNFFNITRKGNETLHEFYARIAPTPHYVYTTENDGKGNYYRYKEEGVTVGDITRYRTGKYKVGDDLFGDGLSSGWLYKMPGGLQAFEVGGGVSTHLGGPTGLSQEEMGSMWNLMHESFLNAELGDRLYSSLTAASLKKAVTSKTPGIKGEIETITKTVLEHETIDVTTETDLEKRREIQYGPDGKPGGGDDVVGVDLFGIKDVFKHREKEEKEAADWFQKQMNDETSEIFGLLKESQTIALAEFNLKYEKAIQDNINSKTKEIKSVINEKFGTDVEIMENDYVALNSRWGNLENKVPPSEEVKAMYSEHFNKHLGEIYIEVDKGIFTGGEKEMYEEANNRAGEALDALYTQELEELAIKWKPKLDEIQEFQDILYEKLNAEINNKFGEDFQVYWDGDPDKGIKGANQIFYEKLGEIKNFGNELIDDDIFDTYGVEIYNMGFGNEGSSYETKRYMVGKVWSDFKLTLPDDLSGDEIKEYQEEFLYRLGEEINFSKMHGFSKTAIVIEAKQIEKELTEGRTVLTKDEKKLLRIVEDIIDTPENFSKWGVVNFWTGLTSKRAEYWIPIAGDFIDGYRQGQIRDIIDKKDKGGTLNSTEEDILMMFLGKQQIQQRLDGLSTGYTVGQGTIDTLKFMAEMVLTRGIGRAAKGASMWVVGSKASYNSLKVANATLGGYTKVQRVKLGFQGKYIHNRVKQGALDTWGNAWGLMAQTVTGGSGRIYSDYQFRMTKEMTFAISVEGEKLVSAIDVLGYSTGEVDGMGNPIYEQDKDGFDTYFKSINHVYIDYVTERFGGPIAKLFKDKKLFKQAVIGRWMKRMKINPAAQDVLAAFKKAGGWNGILPEILEEMAAQPLHNILDGKNITEGMDWETFYKPVIIQTGMFQVAFGGGTRVYKMAKGIKDPVYIADGIAFSSEQELMEHVRSDIKANGGTLPADYEIKVSNDYSAYNSVGSLLETRSIDLEIKSDNVEIDVIDQATKLEIEATNELGTEKVEEIEDMNSEVDKLKEKKKDLKNQQKGTDVSGERRQEIEVEIHEINGQIGEINKKKKVILQPIIEKINTEKTTPKYQKGLDNIKKFLNKIDPFTTVLEMDNDQDTEAFIKENEMERRYKEKGVQKIVNAETGKTVYIDIQTNQTLGKQDLIDRGIIKEGMEFDIKGKGVDIIQMETDQWVKSQDFSLVHGTTFKNIDNKDVIVINKSAAIKLGAHNVSFHETLHRFLNKTFQDHPHTKLAIGNALETHLMNLNPKQIQNSDLRKRIQSYQNEQGDFVSAEETLTVFSDAIAKGEITFNENTFTKMGDMFRRALSAAGMKVEFESGRSVMNFVKDYNKAMESGTMSAGMRKTFKKGARITGRIKQGSDGYASNLRSLGYEQNKDGSFKSVRDDSGLIQFSRDVKPDVDQLGVGWDNKSWKENGARFAMETMKEERLLDNLIYAKYKAEKVPSNFVDLVYSELTPDVQKFNEGRWGTEEENDSLFGYLQGRIQYRADAVYNREFKTPEAMKGAKDVDAKTREGAPVVQLKAETEKDFDVKERFVPGDKGRVLSSLSNVNLLDIEFIDAAVMQVIEKLIKENPSNLEQQLEALIEKEFTKFIIDGMGGKIQKIKGETIISDDYQAFHSLEYDNIVNSLSDQVIKKNYNNLFDIKKTRREKDKKVDPITGKITYPGKGIYTISKTNKAKWIKFFTQGGYTTLRARQTSLAKLIAEAKAKEVIDEYLNTNISNVSSAILEKVSEKLDKQKNQIRSFDTLKFSKDFGLLQKKAYSWPNRANSHFLGMPLCPLVNGRRNLNALFPNGKGTYGDVFTRGLNDFVKMFPEFRDIFRSTLTGGKRAGWYTNVDNFDSAIPETGVDQRNMPKKSYSITGTRLLNQNFVKLFNDQDFIEDQGKRLPLLKDVFKAIETYLSIGDNKQNVWIFEEILKDTSKHMSTFTRILAPISFVPKVNGKYVFDQVIVEEHTDPQNQVGKGLLWAAFHGEVDIMWKTIGQSYMQGAILKKHDPEGNLKSAMPQEYYQHTVPLLKSGELKLDPGLASVIRLAMSGPKNKSNVIDLNIYHLDPMGIKKSITEYFSVNTDQKITPEIIKLQNQTIVKVLTGEIKQNQAAKEFNSKLKLITTIDIKGTESKIKYSKAINTARATNINTESRGMSAWDFDDTLAYTKSGVRATIPNLDGTPQPSRKVIFLAGGAGSGKGNVISKLGLENQGFKVVNQDISLEWLKKNNGLPENMNDLTKEQRSKLGSLQHQARGIAKRKMMKYQGNADGIVVDGTGGSIKVMESLVSEFKDKGYDVSMLFVETSLETALERNKARKERSLLDKIVIKNHEAVQGNKDGFKDMFSDRFMEVKTDNLKQEDAMPSKLVTKMNNFVSGYKKVRLDAEEFATQGAEILDQGGEFDFTEFDVVTEGEVGPMFKTAMDRAKKFGTKDTYVLTARPPEAIKPIHEFLESQGLSIPIENITGLGNSTAKAKADWMLGKFSEGYNNIFFADDAMQNVEAVKDVLSQLDIKSEVIQAKIKFSKDMESTIDEILEDDIITESKKEASINNVKTVDGLANRGNYSNIKFSKKHRGEYENVIAKHRPDLVKWNLVSTTVDSMFDFVDGLNVPNDKKRKYERLTVKWLATSNIKLGEDAYKIKDAVELAEKHKEDIFSYRNPNEIIEKYAGKSKKKPIDPKKVDEFKGANTINSEHGLVSYEIIETTTEDKRDAMNKVREIVDTHWGPNSNPWCLIARTKKPIKGQDVMDDAFQNWIHYQDGPKRVVFQNGKLLAFYANDLYWDRMDNSTDNPVVQIKEGRVTKKVELVPIGKDKVEEFVMETRTVSKDGNTVTTDILHETQDGYSVGTKIIENRVNGITVKSTRYAPKGHVVEVISFDKSGKAVNNIHYNPIGNIRGINRYAQRFGDMSKLEIVEKKGDLISLEARDGDVDLYHAEINLAEQGIAIDRSTHPITEIGWKMPKNTDLKSVIKTSPLGKIRVDLKKILEIDPNTKGLPRKAAGSIKFSKDVDLNQILEESMGVEAKKRFSGAQAKLRGKGFKFRGLIPPSAQDFAGLLYNLIGKGKKGEQHFDILKKALIDPFARGYNELNTARQNTAEDYRNLIKKFPEVKKILNKKLSDDSAFTVDQAIRVYLWNKAGYKVPGLSTRDLQMLDGFVKQEGSEDVRAFADALGVVSKKSEGYSKPGEYWLTENINSDLMSDGAIGDARAEFLTEWVENKNIIFSEENLNKIEAIYGSKFREALEDMLYRMETGRNRPAGSGRILNMYMNWVNQSVGAIMFFNIRSAVLQTISATNYINWSDNNPLKAAIAFANQPQFWSDFTMIFNSDMLRQRRAGLRYNVNEAELAAAVAKSDNKVKAALNWLLKKGFLPTQIADSFAIASGGAAFYRNRVKSHMKNMSRVEAEKQAWLDFQETTEVSQQSSRPDLISQQQANPLGRLILAFQNTPMQYGRIMNKALRDIINGRGDTKTHVSKVVYYGGIQAVVFTALQSAMFAVIGTDDDDEKEEMIDKKSERMISSMIDSWLSVFGYGGKAVSTIKNTIREYNKQRAKDLDEEFMTRSDHAYTLIQALSFSPPISSKVRKIYQSIQTEKFNRDLMKERGLTLDNPAWSMIGNVVEGVTNIPLGRISNKLLNLDNAMDSNLETWQRIALIMGWNTWDLGIKDPDLVSLGADIKERKKEQKKEQAKIETEEKKIIKLKEKYPDKSNEEIEIIIKSKELFDLSKQTQIDVLKALDLSDKEIEKLKKEKDRTDYIANAYKDNNELIEKTIESSKSKPKETKKEEKKKKKKKTEIKLSKSEKREKELFKLNKKDQINLLIKHGVPNAKIKLLKYEKDRVKMIIKLENKKSK